MSEIKIEFFFGLKLGETKIRISQQKKIISERAKKYKLFGPTKGKKKRGETIRGVNKVR
jgi:hypothetical protein